MIDLAVKGVAEGQQVARVNGERQHGVELDVERDGRS
jgi:hypothetical protein